MKNRRMDSGRLQQRFFEVRAQCSRESKAAVVEQKLIGEPALGSTKCQSILQPPGRARAHRHGEIPGGAAATARRRRPSPECCPLLTGFTVRLQIECLSAFNGNPQDASQLGGAIQRQAHALPYSSWSRIGIGDNLERGSQIGDPVCKADTPESHCMTSTNALLERTNWPRGT